MLPRTDGTLSVKAGTGGTIIIIWPNPWDYIDFNRNLERAAEYLGPDTVWTTLTNAPTTTNGVKQTIVRPSRTSEFYRLKQTP